MHKRGRHIYANFKGQFSCVKLRSLFQAASKATRVREFNELIRKINLESDGAYDYLKGIEPSIQSRHAFDNDVKVDHVTNMTKSFNSWLNRVRFKPIVEPFKEVRRKIMRRMVRRKEMLKNG